MPSYSTLVLTFALAVVVRGIPVDEISARNDMSSTSSGVGGQAPGGSVASSANNCTGSATSCLISNPSDFTLAKIDSENAGNGGGALSGASSGATLFRLVEGTNSTRKAPAGGSVSGDGGEAPGGSVADNHPALLELGSDNAGTGGEASSRNSNSSGLVG